MVVSSPERRVSVAIPWGLHQQLPLDLPAHWPVADVHWPSLDDAISDYPKALDQALEAPVDSERLERLAGPGTRVAIVVDDPSRWTPVAEALPLVLQRLHAVGVRPADVCVCVGVGRHHAVNADAMRRRVGDAIARDYCCFSPPVDDLSQYAYLGRTPEGVPVQVFRPVAEAGLRVLIGSVLPHLQAGFGGGYKLIFPGTCHRSTLGALHRQGLSGDAGHLLGTERTQNPMRRAIGSAAALLAGPTFSISHLVGPPGGVFRVTTGNPEAVQDILAALASERFRVGDGALADVVVAGNHPWPGDPMQSFKVLLHHRAASRPGGVLVGFFWTDPEQIDRSFPLRSLRLIAATGAIGGLAIRAGLHLAEKAVALAGSPAQFLVRWARELVVDRTVLVYAPALCDRIGTRLGPVRVFSQQEPLWKAAQQALGHGAQPHVRVFPEGGLTYCALSQEPLNRPAQALAPHATNSGGLR